MISINQIKYLKVIKINYIFNSCCKVLTFEIGHLFGIKHCIYWQCRMNGANHQNELIRNLYLCPICLHKLFIADILKYNVNKDNNHNDDNKDEGKKEDMVNDANDTNDTNDTNDKMKLMRERMEKRNRRRKQNDNVKPFNLMDRYKKLQEWCLKTGLIEEANWYQSRLQMVTITTTDHK